MKMIFFFKLKTKKGKDFYDLRADLVQESVNLATQRGSNSIQKLYTPLYLQTAGPRNRINGRR